MKGDLFHLQAGRSMGSIARDHSLEAIEVRRPLKARLYITVATITIMIMLLGSAFSIYVLDNNGINDPGIPSDKKGSNDLEIKITQGIDQLISNKQMTIKGKVENGDGFFMDNAKISAKVPLLTSNVYRSFTDPNGQFELNMVLPPFDGSGNYTLEILSEKDGYNPDVVDLYLEYLRPPKWTFMVYMSDCDLETWALKDINEMETIAGNEMVDIVVQLDRWESLSVKDDRSDGNWTTAKRFLIEEDVQNSIIRSTEVQDIGEINSAEPEQLVDFSTWAMEEYPADHYALILWNHGSGIDGICWEQSLETEEVISINELGWALTRISDISGQNLDIIGFDACLMSAMEVAYEISGTSDIMIGSEITEPAYGWDYTVIDDLVDDPYMTPMQLSKNIVESYISQLGDIGSKKSMSLGVYDLSKMEDLADALNDLSTTISNAGSSELYNMRIARKYAQPIQEGHSSDAVDLYDFVDNIGKTTDNSIVREKAAIVLDRIGSCVIHFDKIQVGGFSIDGLNGLSIYAPDFKDVLNSNEDYDDLKMSSDVSWKDLLIDYYDSMNDLIEDKILDFDVALLSCSTSDKDNDGRMDTMKYHFSVHSKEDNVDAFLGINIYDLRGDHISSIGHSFVVSSENHKSFTVSFTLDAEDGGPGMYRVTAYLCKGNSFDQRFFQDYTRSSYRWLEIYND